MIVKFENGKAQFVGSAAGVGDEGDGSSQPEQVSAMKKHIAGTLGVPAVVVDPTTGEEKTLISQEEVDEAIADGAVPLVQKEDAPKQEVTFPAILWYHSASHGKDRFYTGWDWDKDKPGFSYDINHALKIQNMDHLMLAGRNARYRHYKLLVMKVEA